MNADKRAAEQAANEKKTLRVMTCRECSGKMLIGQAGLICENGCGKIVHPDFVGCGLPFLRRVWPSRVIHSQPAQQRLAAISNSNGASPCES